MRVTVRIDNAYECGRKTNSMQDVAPPTGPEPAAIEQWFQDVVHDLTGDGHACGRSENAIYEATVIAAPGMRDLVGQTREWG